MVGFPRPRDGRYLGLSRMDMTLLSSIQSRLIASRTLKESILQAYVSLSTPSGSTLHHTVRITLVTFRRIRRRDLAMSSWMQDARVA